MFQFKFVHEGHSQSSYHVLLLSQTLLLRWQRVSAKMANRQPILPDYEVRPVDATDVEGPDQ